MIHFRAEISPVKMKVYYYYPYIPCAKLVLCNVMYFHDMVYGKKLPLVNFVYTFKC